MAGYPASSPRLFKKCKQVAGAIPAEVIPVTERQPHTRTRSRAVDTDEEALSGPHVQHKVSQLSKLQIYSTMKWIGQIDSPIT